MTGRGISATGHSLQEPTPALTEAEWRTETPPKASLLQQPRISSGVTGGAGPLCWDVWGPSSAAPPKTDAKGHQGKEDKGRMSIAAMRYASQHGGSS